MQAKPKARKRSAKVYDNKLHREFDGDWADDPDGPFFRNTISAGGIWPMAGAKQGTADCGTRSKAIG
jgi:hypothetical protein